MTRGQIAALLTLTAGAAVLAAALIWIGRTTLRLEAAEDEARRLAAREEKARLALWRLDSTLTAVIGRENARPAEAFSGDGAAEPQAFALRRFEVDPRRPAALVRGVSGLSAAALSAALDTAQPLPGIEPSAVVQAPAAVPSSSGEASPRQIAAEPVPPAQAVPLEPRAAPQPSETPASTVAPAAPAAAREIQTQLNTNEFLQRAQNATAQSSFVPRPEAPTPSPASPSPQHPEAPGPDPGGAREAAPQASGTAARPPEPPVRHRPLRPTAAPPRTEASRVETTFQPVWIAGELYLVRRVRENGTEMLQTVWMDWQALRRRLLGQVGDLLPAADLEPVSSGEAADPGRLLALLPVRLVPGVLPPAPQARGWTPARLALAGSSGAIALAGIAVAALLLGSLRQSQRRADFVSAVTHELRTPLTTLQMYSEMLASGMVPTETAPEYLATLHAEAARLGHLVENVLAYARLERSPAAGGRRSEVLALGELLAGIAGRLRERAARDGFTLAVSPAQEELQGWHVEVDPAALERILFNWADNACKYAAGASDRRLEISASRRSRSTVLRLADHGPGIPRGDRKRIFRPFHKSAARAAASAPGVGLGLALSRRLARSLGGDLSLVESSAGAVFELVLRGAPGSAVMS